MWNSSTTHRSGRTTWEQWTVTWFWSCAVVCLTVVVVPSHPILKSLLLEKRSACFIAQLLSALGKGSLGSHFECVWDWADTLSNCTMGLLRLELLLSAITKFHRKLGSNSCHEKVPQCNFDTTLTQTHAPKWAIVEILVTSSEGGQHRSTFVGKHRSTFVGKNRSTFVGKYRSLRNVQTECLLIKWIWCFEILPKRLHQIRSCQLFLQHVLN